LEQQHMSFGGINAGARGRRGIQDIRKVLRGLPIEISGGGRSNNQQEKRYDSHDSAIVVVFDEIPSPGGFCCNAAALNYTT
jgi:hypothetical protein